MSGQVDLLCMWEQGSKWIMGRLMEGIQEEGESLGSVYQLAWHLCQEEEHFMIILYLVRKNATKIYLILNISIVHAV